MNGAAEREEHGVARGVGVPLREVHAQQGAGEARAVEVLLNVNEKRDPRRERDERGDEGLPPQGVELPFPVPVPLR